MIVGWGRLLKHGGDSQNQEFMLKTMLDFRAVQLYINNERMNQLCLVGKAAERFWDLAIHQRRGLGSCVWSDVTSVELWDVTKKDALGGDSTSGDGDTI